MRENAAVCRAALPPIITGGFRRRRGFAIFGDKSPFALSRKWKNGKRVDSRSRENDGDIHPRLIRGGFAAATFAALRQLIPAVARPRVGGGGNDN